MKHFPLLPLFLVTASVLLASCGEDRSGEQPLAPTIVMGGAVQQGDSVCLSAMVTSSVNSSLKECGFYYGNDTLALQTKADSAAASFQAFTDSLGSGEYYVVAYAKNGVGTTKADTAHFTVE